MEKIAAALFVGVLAGSLAGYWLSPKPSDARMHDLEQQIAAKQQELSRQQKISQERLDQLNAIEEQKKLNNQKMKESLDELQRTNIEIHNVFERLRAQVKILRTALCNYHNDFCTTPAPGGTNPG